MNDPDITVMFSVPVKDLIKEQTTCACLSADYNRKPTPEQHDQIESVWKQRRTNNPKLYNGTKFRLDSVVYSDKNGSLLTMNIGLTSYKDFIGTNWSPNAKSLLELGKRNFDNTQAYMSDAMGVGAFVKTCDDQVIFLKRSLYCGEAAGLWDIPGGHAEPQELVGKVQLEEIDIEKLTPHAVIHEMYDSILREVVDEVNIPKSSLSEPELLGIARNETSAGRPSVEFLIRCSLNSTEVLDLYQQGTHAEADESTNIRIVPVDYIMNIDTEDEFWKNMAPSSKGCMILYRLHQQKLSSSS